MVLQGFWYLGQIIYWFLFVTWKPEPVESLFTQTNRLFWRRFQPFMEEWLKNQFSPSVVTGNFFVWWKGSGWITWDNQNEAWGTTFENEAGGVILKTRIEENGNYDRICNRQKWTFFFLLPAGRSLEIQLINRHWKCKADKTLVERKYTLKLTVLM